MTLLEDRIRDSLECEAELRAASLQPGRDTEAGSALRLALGVAAVTVVAVVAASVVGVNGVAEAPGEPAQGPPVTLDDDSNARLPDTPSVSGDVSLPDPVQVSIPVEGTEPFLLAAGNGAVFAAASIPDPEAWRERVWRSVDRGQTWELVFAADDRGVVVDIAARGNDVAVLMSNHGTDEASTLIRSTDGGTTWVESELPPPSGAAGYEVRSVALGEVVVVTGGSWEGRSEQSLEDGEVVVSRPTGLLQIAWVIGSDGTPAVSTVDTREGAGIMDVAWSDGTFIAVGTAGQLTGSTHQAPAMWSSVDGVTWEPIDIPPVPDGLGTNDGLAWVAVAPDAIVAGAYADVIADVDTPAHTRRTIVYASTDGQSWSRMAASADHLMIGTPAAAGPVFIAASGSDRAASDTAPQPAFASQDGSIQIFSVDTGGGLPSTASNGAAVYMSGPSGIWRVDVDS